MRVLLALGAASLLALPLAAAEITTLAGAAVQGPLLDMAARFRTSTGHDVSVTFDTVPSILRRLGSGDRTDVLIATSAGVAQVIGNGTALPDTRTPLGRVGVAVAVSRGDRAPDISTPERLAAAILQSGGVVTSQGTSGLYVMQMLADLGLMDRIKAKTTQLASGVAVMERLGTSRNEIGFTQLSEVIYGEAHGGGTLVGPLPAALQNFTVYEAIVMRSAASPEVATAFVRTLASEPARVLFRAAGWEPADAGSR